MDGTLPSNRLNPFSLLSGDGSKINEQIIGKGYQKVNMKKLPPIFRSCGSNKHKVTVTSEVTVTLIIYL